MITVIQRVAQAEVSVSNQIVGQIGPGLLALVAIEKGDTEAEAVRLVEKMLGYRIFSDEEGKMNLNVKDIDGEVLLVSQFTLAADTRKGMRPSFTPAADPATGLRLFEAFVEHVRQRHPKLATGQFGADMQVSLINDGPVTFQLRIPPPSRATSIPSGVASV